MELLSIAEAAVRLGVTPHHMLRLVKSGAVAGKRVGAFWVVEQGAVEAETERRKALPSRPPGRPPGAKNRDPESFRDAPSD